MRASLPKAGFPGSRPVLGRCKWSRQSSQKLFASKRSIVSRTDPQAVSPLLQHQVASSQNQASGRCSQPVAHTCKRAIILGGVCLVGSWLLQTPTSQAALVRLPANELNNRYFLVRAGESYAESFGEPLTNPVWKTSEKHGLSPLGQQQVLRGLVPDLERLGACGDSCWVWPSITQNAYQTAEVLAYELGIGRSRIVPEYSFLDARGLGALENERLQVARRAVVEGDLLDINWRPPKGTDGTPHESASDLLVRMRQVLSITETQYSGEDVLLVAPDSDCLSVLQAAVLGVDLRQHARYAFRPGEVRPLQLSTEASDLAPVSFACRDPPKCTREPSPPTSP